MTRGRRPLTGLSLMLPGGAPDGCSRPAMAAGLGATAWLAIRRDRWLAVPAVSTATLLAADAGPGVCTAAAGRPLARALAGPGVEREAPQESAVVSSLVCGLTACCPQR
jgi:hypothetical protein